MRHLLDGMQQIERAAEGARRDLQTPPDRLEPELSEPKVATMLAGIGRGQ